MREQWDAAAEILGVKGKPFFGGVENCDFTTSQISDLLDLGFILPENKFNNSPTVETFFNFGKRAKATGASVKYIGFLESKSRDNARAVIEGVRITNFTHSTNLLLDFAQIFHDADEFTANSGLLRAWYD